MKCTSVFSAAIVLGLAACDTMNRPISSGDFDPLRPPGGDNYNNNQSATTFAAGSFVRAVMNNTAFFKNRPKGNSDADKLLPRGTSMKVISHRDSYVKVELDSGEVGYVPSVMLEDPNAAIATQNPNPGEFQVYPPLNGYGAPLPPLDPAELPPDGVIPTVIDPDAPSAIAPLPPVAPATGGFPAPPPIPEVPAIPAEATPSPPPLPPNGEELEAARAKAEAAPKLEE